MARPKQSDYGGERLNWIRGNDSSQRERGQELVISSFGAVGELQTKHLRPNGTETKWCKKMETRQKTKIGFSYVIRTETWPASTRAFCEVAGTCCFAPPGHLTMTSAPEGQAHPTGEQATGEMKHMSQEQGVRSY